MIQSAEMDSLCFAMHVVPWSLVGLCWSKGKFMPWILSLSCFEASASSWVVGLEESINKCALQVDFVTVAASST